MIDWKRAPQCGLTLSVLVALGLAACGGDAGNGEQAAETPGAAPAQAQPAPEAEATTGAAPQELPEGVTAEMIEEGEAVFTGAGICSSCHGPAGEGVPNLGADLTDDEWLHSDGSYEGISESVINGVTAQESSSGIPMPAKGGTAITDEQAKAVAAYVWALSQG